MPFRGNPGSLRHSAPLCIGFLEVAAYMPAGKDHVSVLVQKPEISTEVVLCHNLQLPPPLQALRNCSLGASAPAPMIMAGLRRSGLLLADSALAWDALSQRCSPVHAALAVQ